MNTSPQLQEIEAQALQQLLLKDSVTLIDVRETAEHAAERIPGATLHPLSQFEPQQIQSIPGKTVVLYCRSGNRSSQAAQRCLAAGLPDTAHLKGGIITWKAAGYTLEKSHNAPISLFRQVQIVAGLLVVFGIVLGVTVSPSFLLLSGFVGTGLVFAGMTNTCAMGMLLAKLPYNQQAVLSQTVPVQTSSAGVES